MNVAQETLGFRRAGLSPGLSLLMSAFALPIPPARVTPHLHRPTERSPTTPYAPRARLTPPSPPSGCGRLDFHECIAGAPRLRERAVKRAGWSVRNPQL